MKRSRRTTYFTWGSFLHTTNCSRSADKYHLRVVVQRWNVSLRHVFPESACKSLKKFCARWIAPGAQKYSTCKSLFYAMNCSRRTTYFHLRIVFLHMNCFRRTTYFHLWVFFSCENCSRHTTHFHLRIVFQRRICPGAQNNIPLDSMRIVFQRWVIAGTPRIST